jgi:hypothetical protein
MKALVRTATIAAGAVAVGATAGALTLGGAASASSQTTTMHLVAHDQQFAMDDLGDPSPQGPGLGDVLVMTQRLTNHGKTVGLIHNSSVDVDARRNLFQSTGSVSLAHGTIEFAGVVSQTEHFKLAITGGTGDYRGAGGTIAFDFPGHRQLLTVTVTR